MRSEGINDSSSGSEVYLACLCSKESWLDLSETSDTRVQTLCVARDGPLALEKTLQHRHSKAVESVFTPDSGDLQRKQTK